MPLHELNGWPVGHALHVPLLTLYIGALVDEHLQYNDPASCCTVFAYLVVQFLHTLSCSIGLSSGHLHVAFIRWFDGVVHASNTLLLLFTLHGPHVLLVVLYTGFVVLEHRQFVEVESGNGIVFGH